MPHGYGFWTFGWKAGERLTLFNERWQRLTAIHAEVTESLLVPLDAISLSQRDTETILRLATDMGEWCEAIGSSLPDTTSAAFAGYAGPSDRANGNHLRSYAAAIKNVVLKATKLCRKYGVVAMIPVDGEAVAVADCEFVYDAQRKMVMVDGKDLYFLGSGGAPQPDTQQQQPVNSPIGQQPFECSWFFCGISALFVVNCFLYGICQDCRTGLNALLGLFVVVPAIIVLIATNRGKGS